MLGRYAKCILWDSQIGIAIKAINLTKVRYYLLYVKYTQNKYKYIQKNNK